MLVRFEKCFIRFITCFNKSPMFLYAYSQIFFSRTDMNGKTREEKGATQI